MMAASVRPVNFDTETTAKLASCDARWATECSFAVAMGMAAMPLPPSRVCGYNSFCQVQLKV